ncbi:hypothetical protein ACP3V5_02875 [Vibrio maritimus]
MMIRRIAFLGLILISLLSEAKEQRLNMSLEWFHANYHQIENVLSQKSSFELVPIASTLTEIWLRRDGGLTAEVSQPIVVALIYHPNVMLPMLVEHPKSFSRWLDDLDGVVFTDYSGEQYEELTHLHLSLEQSMENYISSGDLPYKAEAQEILEIVKATKVREID